MTHQPEIDFVHTRENNPDSEDNLRKQRGRFNSQTHLVLETMQSGETWTNLKAKERGIMQLATRIWELINIAHIPVQKRWVEIEGVRYKEYFLEPGAKL